MVPGSVTWARLRLAGPWPPSGRASSLLAAQLALVVAASLVSAYLLVRTGDWRITFGLFGLAGFVCLGLVRPAAFLAAILLLRPLLDSTTESRFGPVNVSGVVGLVAVGVLGALVVTSRRLHRPAATVPCVIVLLLSAVACVPAFANFGDETGLKSIAELTRVAAIFAVYLLAANLRLSGDRVKTLAAVFGMSGVVPAIMGVNELIQGGETALGLDIHRVAGPFVGPQGLGIYSAATALVLIGLPRRTLPGWVRVPSFTLILIALVGTYSRAGWALFVIGFVVLGWRERRSLVIAGAAAITALVLLVPPVHDRILPPREGATATGRTVVAESYSFRIDTWKGLLEKWAERPVVGYGLETTGVANPRQVSKEPGVYVGYDAHNSVVKLLVEGGVPLLAAYVALLVVLFRKLRQLARPQWRGRRLAHLMVSVWIGTLVIGLATDDPLAVTPAMYGLFAVTGALEGAFARARGAHAEPGPAT